jgi:hypothetical protein
LSGDREVFLVVLGIIGQVVIQFQGRKIRNAKRSSFAKPAARHSGLRLGRQNGMRSLPFLASGSRRNRRARLRQRRLRLH